MDHDADQAGHPSRQGYRRIAGWDGRILSKAYAAPAAPCQFQFAGRLIEPNAVAPHHEVATPRHIESR